MFYLTVVKDAACGQVVPMRYLLRTPCCNEGVPKNRNQNQKRSDMKSGMLDALILELLEVTQEKVITSPGPNKPQSLITFPMMGDKDKSFAENLPSGLTLNQILEASTQMLDPKQIESNPGLQQLSAFLEVPDSKRLADNGARRISATIVEGGNSNNPEAQKAYACSQLQCLTSESKHTVCACNFKTGNVVSFKNECDLRKHNCRYDTGTFSIFLNKFYYSCLHRARGGP